MLFRKERAFVDNAADGENEDSFQQLQRLASHFSSQYWEIFHSLYYLWFVKQGLRKNKTEHQLTLLEKQIPPLLSDSVKTVVLLQKMIFDKKWT